MGRAPAGYTLLELIVVVALMGVVLLAALPRFEGFLAEEGRKTERFLLAALRTAREEAQRTQRTRIVHFDLEAGLLWETALAPRDPERETGLLAPRVLPGGGRVTGVEFPRRGLLTRGRAEIRFFPDGTSDRALIHVSRDGQASSFLVETFLSRVKSFDGLVHFDDPRL
ncbi:MAG: GspH/FimT family protein [Desulfobacterales bacterium]